MRSDAEEGSISLPDVAPDGHFGADLSHVQVHTSTKASNAAASLNALAYTVGSNIYFANGMYAPQTSDGQRLLAHEVAHVVQQGSVKAPSTAGRWSSGRCADRSPRIHQRYA